MGLFPKEIEHFHIFFATYAKFLSSVGRRVHTTVLWAQRGTVHTVRVCLSIRIRKTYRQEALIG